jgi:glycosyltransferase involved in cell wall biosynthesis
MITRPFFTVIICTYNRAGLLPRALESLFQQTFRDWEVVIVDDGSTDSTKDVVQNYANGSNPVVYLHTSNGGIGRARNAGILAGKGLFYTFLDSDDEYKANHLEYRHTVLTEHPHIDFLHGGVVVVGNPMVPDKNDPLRLIAIEDCAVGGTFVLHHSLPKRIGGFLPLRFGDDAEFYERALASGVVTVGKTNEQSYVYYRDTPDSLCSTLGTHSQQPTESSP